MKLQRNVKKHYFLLFDVCQSVGLILLNLARPTVSVSMFCFNSLSVRFVFPLRITKGHLHLNDLVVYYTRKSAFGKMNIGWHRVRVPINIYVCDQMSVAVFVWQLKTCPRILCNYTYRDVRF